MRVLRLSCRLNVRYKIREYTGISFEINKTVFQDTATCDCIAIIHARKLIDLC